MDVSYDAMKFWFDVLIALLLFGNWIWMWLTNRQRVNKAEIEEVSSEVVKLVNRVSLVEERMKGAPTHTDLSNIYNRINGMSQDISEMTGALKALTNQMTLINEHLINSGSK